MNTNELVSAVLLKATGKARTLQPSDTKYQKILAIANLYIQQWQREPGVDWTSHYGTLTAGNITNTDTYTLDLDTVVKISDAIADRVVVQQLDGGESSFQIISPEDLKRYEGSSVCAQAGDKLIFARQFDESSPEYGGSIEIPVYLKAQILESDSDKVPVDDPMWLVVITAAEYVRNDIMLQNQHGTLIAEANQLMQKMIDSNFAPYAELYAPGIPGVSDL